MIFEFTGVCQHCATSVTITVHNGSLLERCPGCKQDPFGVRRIRGLIYVLSNPNQTGVKIGMTEKTVEERAKALNTTGVPGKFEVVVVFPSDRPSNDEERIHERLEKKKLSKEHFDLDAVDAALKCYRILNKRKPIFYNKDVEARFWLQLERDRIDMQLKLKGKTAL